MDYLLGDDQLLLKNNPSITYDTLIWTNKDAFSRFLTGILQKLSNLFSSTFKHGFIFHKIVLNRNYRWQLRRAIAYKADLYIAHNAGALAVAADAAKKNRTRFAFDAEDYHRGEDLSARMMNSLIYLENKYLPEARYITASAPLIATAYAKLYNKPVTTILNVFPTPKLPIDKKTERASLKLFWFSQTVGLGRGIESIIISMAELKDRPIELHLLGNCDEAMKSRIGDIALEHGLNKRHIYYHPPIFADDIFSFASQFDIGMASETGIPLNRDICLTNKIFTYLQSGLAVVASNTSGQMQLIREYPQIGMLYENDNPSKLTSILAYYLDHSEELIFAKEQSLSLAEEIFNWEKEEKKILSIINNFK